MRLAQPNSIDFQCLGRCSPNPRGLFDGKMMKLILVSNAGLHKEFPLEEGDNLIGRWDPDDGAFPELDLEEYDVEAKISRKHALVRRKGDKVTVEDVGSLNGTFVNRTNKLEPGQRYSIEPGDEIMVGGVFLRLER